MFKKLRNLKFYSHLAFATMVVLSGAGAANAADAWNPIGDYDLYIRNNTQKTYATDVLVNIIGGCDGASYPLGYGALFAYFTPGNTSKLIDVTGPIDCPIQKWEFTILDPVDPGSSLRFMAYFALSGAMGAPGMAAPMRTDGFSVSGFQHDVWFTARDKFYDTGAYVTIGTNYFGDLGPTRTSTTDNTLTVTTFNTFLGRDDKPEACTRGQYLQSVLKTLSTDVLLLQEVNYREDACDYDGHDLVSYLWTGVQNDEIADNTYFTLPIPLATPISPKKSGSFPYISQMISGIASGGDEKQTGGGIILSKYPITMLANETFTNCKDSSLFDDDDCNDEEKGFIVVKITKNGKSYFLINTHTFATDESVRKEQFQQIANWINGNRATLAGHRVILGGDLNAGLHSTAANSGGVNKYYTVYDPVNFGSYSGATIMSKQTNTAAYQFSRDNRKNFYVNNSEGTKPGDIDTIDWLIPIISKGGTSFSTPSSYRWWIHPVRYLPFKYAELSDHFAVSAVFHYY